MPHVVVTLIAETASLQPLFETEPLAHVASDCCLRNVQECGTFKFTEE